MDDKFFKGLLIGSVGTLVVALGAVTISQNNNVLNSKSLTKLNTITSIIEKRYYGEYDESDVIKGIYQGACFNLDEYCAYLSDEDYESAVDPDQNFCGIGIMSTYDKYTKVYKIMYCYDGYPAARAGIKRNDIIEAIDGVDIYDVDLDKVSELLRGEEGSIVSLKICRDGELMDIDVVREPIDLPYAYSYQLPDDIGFIKITHFQGVVADDFAEALEPIKDSKGLIIDLRDNFGGEVPCFKAIMEQLLPYCTLQTTVYKDGRTEDLMCESSLNEAPYKYVVLVNDLTASCAEAMTQALADITGAKIVGVETYGKGVAQEYFRVDDSSVLRLTTGYIKSPNGVVWNETGITPDYVVEYEYLGDDFAQSVLMNDSQIRAAHSVMLGLID